MKKSLVGEQVEHSHTSLWVSQYHQFFLSVTRHHEVERGQANIRSSITISDWCLEELTCRELSGITISMSQMLLLEPVTSDSSVYILQFLTPLYLQQPQSGGKTQITASHNGTSCSSWFVLTYYNTWFGTQLVRLTVLWQISHQTQCKLKLGETLYLKVKKDVWSKKLPNSECIQVLLNVTLTYYC